MVLFMDDRIDAMPKIQENKANNAQVRRKHVAGNSVRRSRNQPVHEWQHAAGQNPKVHPIRLDASLVRPCKPLLFNRAPKVEVDHA